MVYKWSMSLYFCSSVHRFDTLVVKACSVWPYACTEKDKYTLHFFFKGRGEITLNSVVLFEVWWLSGSVSAEKDILLDKT